MNTTPDGATPAHPLPAEDSAPVDTVDSAPVRAKDEAPAATFTPQDTTGCLEPPPSYTATGPTEASPGPAEASTGPTEGPTEASPGSTDTATGPTGALPGVTEALPGPTGALAAQETTVGLGPWPGGRDAWPRGDHYDPELLEHGDRRNVEDRYRYWTMDAIRADIAQRTLPFEVAIENLGHDFNIGSIVRTANALGARAVHIVGRKRWNRRGAMVTERYMDVRHHDSVEAFLADVGARGLDVIGIDNTPGSLPIEKDELAGQAVLVFGEESQGLSEEMRQACSRVLHITQRGSTRSMNVGHAAAVAMWAWVRANG